MKQFIVPVVLAMVIVGGASRPLAQGRGGGPKTKGTSGGGSATHGGGAATHGGGAATHGGGSATHGGATTHGGGAAAHGGKTKPAATTQHAGNGSHSKTTTGATKTAKSTPSATTSTTTTSTTTTTTATPTTLTAVQQKLQKNTNLAEKLQSRLPAGTDVIAAAADFRNLGQYVAAVNVSNNLRLDFAKLKTAMVDDGKSLGQAIQLQRSSLDGTTEAQRAQRQADALIASTSTSTTASKPKKTRDDHR